MTELSPPYSVEFEPDSSFIRRKMGWLVGLMAIAVAAGAGYWYFMRAEAGEAPVAEQQTATVATGQLVSSLSTTGTAASTLTSRLTFGASAKVTAVNVKLGDKVEAGQELATLDSSDAVRKLESARVAWTTAQLKLTELLEPATTASEFASALAAISSAKVQLANAEDALIKAQSGPDPDDVLTAENAIATAAQGVTNAENQVQSSWIALLTAQRNYCTTDNGLVRVCYSSDLPLSQSKVDSLIAEIRNPATSAVGTSANSLISAQTSYNNSLTAVTTAEKTLAAARDKRAGLNEPPTALELRQLGSAVESAGASLLAAQTKHDDLGKGPSATDVAQQQESVKSAQISYETAQSTFDSLVLRAPFAGTITAVGIAVGDNATAATAAFTITNTDAIRVELSVQEADFVGLKAGQYGVATFEALAGYSYVVRVTAVNPAPTTTQGVVSYQVQAEILAASQLQDPATQQQATQALSAISGTGARGAPGQNPQGPGGQTAPGGANSGAMATAAAGGAGSEAFATARASGNRPGGQAPGAGAGAAQQGGANLLQTLLSAPAPTPGMNASVTIVKMIETGVLLVPTNALRTTGQVKTVMVKKEDGTAEARSVQTGSSDSTNTVIVSGLTEGEVVVVGAATAAAAASGTQTTGQPGGFPGGGPGVGPGGGQTGATGGVR